MNAAQLIIIVALCVAGLLTLYYILKLLLVVFVVGATARIEQMKQEQKELQEKTKDNENADDKQQ